MARKSSIDKLPVELVGAITKLRDQGRTIDEILAYLADLQTQVSRSALGRHVKGLDEAIDRMRQSRIVAETLVDKLGDAPGSKQAQVNIELLHGVIMDFMLKNEGGAHDPEGLMMLARALADIGRANKLNIDYVLAAEKRGREQAQREAAEAVDEVAKSGGLSAVTAQEIKAKIFGVKE